MQLSEKEIEDLIFEDLKCNSGLNLAAKGFSCFFTRMVDLGIYPKSKWIRQLELGPYGRADIVGYYRMGECVHIELMELKAVPIQVADFEQICRYRTAILEFIHGRIPCQIHMTLIGRGFDSGHYIQNCLKIQVVEVSYTLDGVCFEEHAGNWHRPEAKSYNFLKSLRHAEEIHGY